MNLDNLNKWLVLAANIGVIAGIIFLGIEIQQNNELMESQARFNRYEVATFGSRSFTQVPELASAMVAIREEGPDGLSPQQAIMMEYLYRQIIHGWEWTYFELDQEDIPVARWRYQFTVPSFSELWETDKFRFDPQFVDYINTTIKTHADLSKQ